MITVLTGENSFDIEREVARIISDFHGDVEHIDGSELSISQLPDLLMGGTLFASTRLIIIKNLSENKIVWNIFYEWIPRLSDDTTLILVDSKPDKRTTTYKELKKVATVTETAVWEERDSDKAEQWLVQEAGAIHLTLDKNSARLIVRRAGVDKWQLFHALEKLALVDTVDQATIELLIDAQPHENVFNLFNAALASDREKVSSMVRTLELTEDPYRLFALLSSQAFQLTAVALSGPEDAVARDFGVHPYAVSQLSKVAKKYGRSGTKKIIRIFARADDDMKLSRADPWLLIERALIQVSTV